MTQLISAPHAHARHGRPPGPQPSVHAPGSATRSHRGPGSAEPALRAGGGTPCSAGAPPPARSPPPPPAHPAAAARFSWKSPRETDTREAPQPLLPGAPRAASTSNHGSAAAPRPRITPPRTCRPASQPRASTLATRCRQCQPEPGPRRGSGSRGGGRRAGAGASSPLSRCSRTAAPSSAGRRGASHADALARPQQQGRHPAARAEIRLFPEPRPRWGRGGCTRGGAGGARGHRTSPARRGGAAVSLANKGLALPRTPARPPARRAPRPCQEHLCGLRPEPLPRALGLCAGRGRRCSVLTRPRPPPPPPPHRRLYAPRGSQAGMALPFPGLPVPWTPRRRPPAPGSGRQAPERQAGGPRLTSLPPRVSRPGWYPAPLGSWSRQPRHQRKHGLDIGS